MFKTIFSGMKGMLEGIMLYVIFMINAKTNYHMSNLEWLLTLVIVTSFIYDVSIVCERLWILFKEALKEIKF